MPVAINPCIVVVWAPAIAAFIVIYRFSGLEGLRRYLGRALLWRCSWQWHAFLLLGVPLVFFAGSFLKGNLSEVVFPFDSLSSFLVALVLIAIKGPVEEFGWRGLAIVWLNRKTMFTREYSVTEVVPGERAS